MSEPETSLEINSLLSESHDYHAQKIRVDELENSLKIIQKENAGVGGLAPPPPPPPPPPPKKMFTK